MPRKTILQKCFDEFNHRFFGDRLHDIEVKWSKGRDIIVHDDGKREKLCGYFWDATSENLYKPQVIVLAKNLRRREWMWKLVLLHEMAHADLDLEGEEHHDHGPAFQNRMYQLAGMGAMNGLW